MTQNQIRFVRTLTATWKVLRDPVLTTIYMKKWKRQRDRYRTLYGFVFKNKLKSLSSSGENITSAGPPTANQVCFDIGSSQRYRPLTTGNNFTKSFVFFTKPNMPILPKIKYSFQSH